MKEPTEQCSVTYPHLRHKHRGSTGHYILCPGIKITVRAQPALSRNATLADLREIKRVMGYLVSMWNVDSTVYEQGARDTRPRRIDEYPENDPEAWDLLAKRTGQLITALHNIQTFALDRRDKVKAFNAARKG